MDDIVITAETSTRLEEVKRGLAQKFDIKDMGKLHHFLGMKIDRSQQCIRTCVDWPTELYEEPTTEVWNGSSKASCNSCGHRHQACENNG